jgi:Lrp/AsnC family transcriptional regulator, leucine-responsive regulatory protein
MPDETDLEILRLLAEDARRPYSEIAAAVDLSAPAVSNRVDRLREAGVIRRFTLDIDRSQLEGTTGALVTLTVDPASLPAVRETLAGRDAVTHCFTTADARLVCRVAERPAELREWLLGAASSEPIREYEVTALEAADWSPDLRATGFRLSCAECGNTVTEEGTSARIGGRRYRFCCASCEGQFEKRYAEHADAAD